MSVLHGATTVAFHLNALAERYLRLSIELRRLGLHFTPKDGESDAPDMAFSGIVERSAVVSALTGVSVQDIAMTEVARKHTPEERRQNVPMWLIADGVEPLREFALLTATRAVEDRYGSPWPEVAAAVTSGGRNNA